VLRERDNNYDTKTEKQVKNNKSFSDKEEKEAKRSK